MLKSTHTLHITDISGTLCKFEESGASESGGRCDKQMPHSMKSCITSVNYWSYKLKETCLGITPDLTDFTYLKSQFTWKKISLASFQTYPWNRNNDLFKTFYAISLKLQSIIFFWLKMIQNKFDQVHNQPVFKTISLP